MRLLVIEDDKHISWLLRQSLQPYYTIEHATTGKDGLSRATQYRFDAIILDLGLPDISGLQVCTELRQTPQTTTPILVLTGEADRVWITRLLDAGADDYLTKPFRLEELLARLRAIIRRNSVSAHANVLTAGDLELDTAQRVVRRQGHILELRRKEFDILEYFMHNQSQTLTRAMILEHVWSANEEPWGNVIDVHIKHLRDTVDRPFAEQLIHTVHGVGYKLEAPSKKAAEGAVAPQQT